MQASTNNLSVSELKPISYLPPANSAGSLVGVQEIETASASLKFGSTAVVKKNAEDNFTLSSGDLLITVTKPIVVNCDGYKITLEPGTIAMFSKTSKSLKVHDLWETKSASIDAFVGKRRVDISAGQELIVSASNTQVTQEMRLDQIARRRISIYDISKSDAASRSEISIVSLVQSNPLLWQLFHSKRPADKALSEKLIKMAACLTQATTNHGPYSLSSR